MVPMEDPNYSPRMCCHFQEVLQQLRPLYRQEAFRMELNAVERPMFVADSHDFVFIGPGGDEEIGILKRLSANDQAVIASRFKRIGHALKDAFAIVMDVDVFPCMTR